MATAPTAAGIMDLPENEDMNQAAQLSPMEIMMTWWTL